MDFTLGDTIYHHFTTRAFATGAPTALAGSPTLEIYENDSATPIVEGASKLVLTQNVNGVNGFNLATITATSGNGFEAGKFYTLMLKTGTVGGTSIVGESLWQFTLNAAAAFTRLGAPAGASIAADLVTIGAYVDTVETSLSTLLTRASEVRLAELDAANLPTDIASVKTDTGNIYAIANNVTYGNSALNTDLDSLLTRLSATRAGYLDNLSAGAVALNSTVAKEATLSKEAIKLFSLIESQRGSHTGRGNIYYWNPVTGNDANDGLTPATAKLTFVGANALVVAYAHDIIIILPGNTTGNTVITEKIDINKAYTLLRGPGGDIQFTPTTAGAATVTISAKGCEFSGAVVNTHTTGSADAIAVTVADHVLLHNFRVDYSRGHGIYLRNSAHCLIEKFIINDAAQGGSGKGLLIHGDVSATNWNLVRNFNFQGCQGDAIEFRGAFATDNYILGGGEGGVIDDTVGWGITETTGADDNHVCGPNIHFSMNTLGDVNMTGVNSSVTNIEQWAKNSVCTVTRLAELDAANLPTDVANVLAESQSHPTLVEMEATIVLAKEATATAIKAQTDKLAFSGVGPYDVKATLDGETVTLAAATHTGAIIPTVTNLTNAPTTGDLTATMKASVNAEVVDALATDTYAEVGAAPAATSSLKDKINWLFALARNKITQTSTTQTLRNDADAASIATSTHSDDGTTHTKGEWV